MRSCKKQKTKKLTSPTIWITQTETITHCQEKDLSMPSGGALGDSEALTLLVGDCSILFGNQLRIPQLYQAPGTQSTTLSYVKGWRSEHPFPAGKSGCHSFTAPHPGTVLPVPRHPDEGSCQPLANSPRPEGCRQLVRNVNKLETRNAGRERKSGCGSLIVCARVHIYPESCFMHSPVVTGAHHMGPVIRVDWSWPVS